MASRITLPEMGEGVIEGTLARWLVKEGEQIEQFTPIAEVETDKVTTETTSETAGTVLKLCVNEGETVPVGTVLAYVGEPGETIVENGNGTGAREGGQHKAAAPEPQPAPTPVQTVAEPKGAYTGRISPVVGRIAAEHGVDLGRIAGTGRDGRITKEDVLAYVETQETTATPSPASPVESRREAPPAAPSPPNRKSVRPHPPIRMARLISCL